MNLLVVGASYRTAPVGTLERLAVINGTEGDDVFLVLPDGQGGLSAIVDSVHFGASLVGETVGRLPNGAGRLISSE